MIKEQKKDSPVPNPSAIYKDYFNQDIHMMASQGSTVPKIGDNSSEERKYNGTGQSSGSVYFNKSDANGTDKKMSFFQRIQAQQSQSRQTLDNLNIQMFQNKSNQSRDAMNSAGSSLNSYNQKIFFNNQSCTGGSKAIPD
jgi:hypothetical protein